MTKGPIQKSKSLPKVYGHHMRYFIWSIGGLLGLFVMVWGMTAGSAPGFVTGAVIFFAGFAAGNWAEKNL